MKKILLRVIVVLVILLAIVAARIFFSLNGIVKKGVETVGPQVTKVSVTLGAAEISPFSGSGKLTKFLVGNPDGFKTPSAIQFDEVQVGVNIGSLMSDTIVVNELSVQGAQITLEGDLTANNLSKILDNIKGTNAAPPAEPKPKNAPPSEGASKSSKKFIVKDLNIAGTKAILDITLPRVGHKSMSITIPTIHLQDIGTAENGVTAEQLAEDILKPILTEITKQAATAIAGETLDNLKKGDVKGVEDSLKGLLKH